MNSWISYTVFNANSVAKFGYFHIHSISLTVFSSLLQQLAFVTSLLFVTKELKMEKYRDILEISNVTQLVKINKKMF